MLTTFSPAIAFKTEALTDVGEFCGIASAFGNVDRGGDIIAPGAFGESLDRHMRDGTRPACLWSHDMAEPVGNWVEIAERKTGLSVIGVLALESERARLARQLMQRDSLGLSIGYKADRYHYRDDGVRVLENVDLWEISLVTIPMNPKARTTGVKSFSDARSFEHALREQLGLSAREAKSVAAAGWRGLSRADTSTELDELVRELRAVGEVIAKR